MFLVTKIPTACMVRYDANCTHWNSSWTIVCHVLPMINISSSDMSCIYSTMEFDGRQARQYQMTPYSITCDQSLWWKAQTIIVSEPSCSHLRSTVLRLGAFHTEVGFLVCMGHLMAGTGLHDLLEALNWHMHQMQSVTY